MTLTDLHLLSLLTGIAAYFGLTVFSIINLVRGTTGRALLLGAVSTLLFLTALALTGESILSLSLQQLAYFSWLFLALRAMGWSLDHYRRLPLDGLAWLGISAVVLLLAGSGYLWLVLPQRVATVGALTPALIVDLLLSVCGLVAIEQLARNVRSDLRWRLRYLTISFGVIFGFELVYSSFVLISGTTLSALTVAQPAVLAIAAPMVAIASLRNRDHALRFNVSRDFVFQTGVLTTTGISLLLIALAGYYTQLFGGDVGTAVFLLIATMLLVGIAILLGSSSLQSRLRRFISENLYDRKHDYRLVWRQISDQLSEPSSDFSLAQQAIRGFFTVLDTQSGALWRSHSHSSLVPEAQIAVDWNQPVPPLTASALADYFKNKHWIIDLQQPPRDFPVDCSIALNTEFTGIRFLIPLLADQRFTGLIALPDSELIAPLTWEDYDILKLISLQTAGLLELDRAATELSTGRQLATVNKMSTFVVHDLKTISAQLILLLKNADKHKQNPAFVDDMLMTVANTSKRMQKLIEQFQNRQESTDDSVELKQLVAAVVDEYSGARPCPQLIESVSVQITADPARLSSVIGHMLQNAIDATPESGSVTVTVQTNSNWAELVVMDTGCGMTRDFIEQRLFAPFDSTKGVTGMGVGVFQTRDYLQSLGGDVEVHSHPGEGSRFVLRIPISREAA